MHQPDSKQWHQRPAVRALLLILIPLIVAGLYLISTRIILRRPTTVPVTPEPEIQEVE